MTRPFRRNEWLAEANAPASSPMVNEAISTSFIADYYADDIRPILIPANTSEDYERLIFAVWSQQWPSLRRRFIFSTGSLSARSIGKMPFDVQCVPRVLMRDVQLEMQEATSGGIVYAGREGFGRS